MGKSRDLFKKIRDTRGIFHAKMDIENKFMVTKGEQVGSEKLGVCDQCKEIKENNRMGKTRDLFKTIRDTKGPFHAKMGTIKDLKEAEGIKKRWQEYTEACTKKVLMTQITTVVWSLNYSQISRSVMSRGP